MVESQTVTSADVIRAIETGRAPLPPATPSDVIRAIETGEAVGATTGPTPATSSITKKRLFGRERDIETAKIRQEAGIDVEQESLKEQAQQFADIRGRQASLQLGEEAGTAQERINQFAIGLRSRVRSGDLSQEEARQQLDQYVEREETGLQTLRSEAQERFRGEAEEFSTGFLPEQQAEAEERIRERIDRSTYGLGIDFDKGVGLDLFAVRRSNLLQKGLQFLEDKKKEVDVNFTKIDRRIKSETGKSVSLKLTGTGKQTAIDILNVGQGILRRPVTSAAVGTIALVTSGTTALLKPAISVAAGKGSLIAKGILASGKAATISLTGLYVGGTIYNIETAPTRKEAARRFGDALAIGGSALVGGSIGSKVGTKLFQYNLNRFPTTVRSRSIQQQIAKNTIKIDSKGQVSRGKGGKYKFDFRTTETIRTEGDKIIKTALTKSSFLGKSLPELKTVFVGKSYPSQSGLRGGLQETVSGKISNTKVTKAIEFQVFGSGEIRGTFGKNFFESKVLSRPIFKDGSTILDTKQVIFKTPKFNILKVFGKKGLLNIGIVSADTRGINPFETRVIPQPTKIPSIDVASSLRVTPSVLPELSLLTLGTPATRLLLPSLFGGQGVKLKIPSVSQPRISLKALSQPAIDVPAIPEIEILSTTDTDIRNIYIPSTPTTPTTPTFDFKFIIPKIPKIPFPSGAISLKGIEKELKQITGKTRYSRSLAAQLLNIRGRQPKILTGLEIRPIIKV